jgi:hypothetical protein
MKIIDADAHMCEPPNLWVERIDTRFRERAPRVIKNPGGKKGAFFVCENLPPLNIAGAFAAGKTFDKGGSLVCVRPTRRQECRVTAQDWRGREKTSPPRHADSFAPVYRPERPLRLRASGLQRLATARRAAADRHAARCASRALCSGGAPRRYTPS